MINQETRHQPGFGPGISVRLQDGQFWIFPVPVFRDGEATSVKSTRDKLASPVYEQLLEAMFEAEDHSALALAELALAIELLGWNYLLVAEEYRSLLCFSALDSAGSSFRAELHRLAQLHLVSHLDGSTKHLAARRKCFWGIPTPSIQRPQSQIANPAA